MKLNKLKLEYKEFDISVDPDALAAAKALDPAYVSAPIVVYVGKGATATDHWAGYQDDRISAIDQRIKSQES